MTTSVFIIAECGSNFRFHNHNDGRPHSSDDNCHLDNAYRMIRAAKECGADAAKFQWVSDYKALMSRRKATMDAETDRIYACVHFPVEWLALLKAECDRVGIEFMCTAYLPQDVAVIAPLVKRFKVAAKEAMDYELRTEIIKQFRGPTIDKDSVIVSISAATNGTSCFAGGVGVSTLACVSKYPTPIEDLHLSWFRDGGYSNQDDFFRFKAGLSDHTAHVLTGAVAVGAGARIIESHVRLHDTPRECPDYGHSLTLDDEGPQGYYDYAQNIRTAERML